VVEHKYGHRKMAAHTKGAFQWTHGNVYGSQLFLLDHHISSSLNTDCDFMYLFLFVVAINN
jgi:hypothetical protein